MLPNLQDLIAMGFNPKTGLPIKFEKGDGSDTVTMARRMFRIIDEQNAVNRYNWINLPDGLDGKLLERILYYKGQGAFFYWPELNQFCFLPFALGHGLDIYGRYKVIKPIPFLGTLEDKDVSDFGIEFKVQYGIKLDEITKDDLISKAVILRDYTPQISQNLIPRFTLNDYLLTNMGEMMGFLRTKLLIGTGISGMKCNSADQKQDVKDLSRAMQQAAASGDPFCGIIGQTQIDLQGLDKSATSGMRAEDYLIALQALDNIRLGAYGLDNGGIFEKKAHITNEELAMNSGSVGLVMQDGLSNRREFCDIINSIWGLEIDVTPSETVTGMDANMDGEVADDPTTPNASPEEETEDVSNI